MRRCITCYFWKGVNSKSLFYVTQQVDILSSGIFDTDKGASVTCSSMGEQTSEICLIILHEFSRLILAKVAKVF